VSDTTIAVWSIPRKRRSSRAHLRSPLPAGNCSTSRGWRSGCALGLIRYGPTSAC